MKVFAFGLSIFALAVAIFVLMFVTAPKRPKVVEGKPVVGERPEPVHGEVTDLQPAKRVEGLEREFKRLRASVELLQRNVDSLHKSVDSLDRRLDNLERDLQRYKWDMDRRLRDLERRVPRTDEAEE